MTAYESVTIDMQQQEYGTCALIQDLLPLYLEGEVSPGSRDTIVEHLARCERCASYLAGAQSVRAQLHRDRAQRVNIFVRDQPARRALGTGQRLATSVVMLALCALGAAASLMVIGSIGEGHPLMFLAGLFMGGIGFVGLGALAQRGGPLSLGRLLQLAGSCLLGALAAVFIIMPPEAEIKLLGMLLALIALGGVWFTLFQEPRVTPQNHVEVR